MKVVMLGKFEYELEYLTGIFEEIEVITEGHVEDADSLDADVLKAMEAFGIQNPKINTNLDFTYYGVGTYRNEDNVNFAITIQPAIQIGSKFYKLEEIA